jgi:hypothetical protein
MREDADCGMIDPGRGTKEDHAILGAQLTGRSTGLALI